MVGVMTEHGYDQRPGPWKPPAVVEPEVAAEAAGQLAWLEGAGLRPAEAAGMRRWLVALGNACAASANASAADVAAKVAVLLTMLEDYPAACFTTASLKRAAKRFRFFPSAEELGKLLDDEAADLRRKRDRLRLIATPPAHLLAGPAVPAAAFAPADDSAKDRVRALLAEAGIGLRGEAAGEGVAS